MNNKQNSWVLNILLLILFVFPSEELEYFPDKPNMPCSVRNSINITGAVNLINGNYKLGSIEYSHDIVGWYDYESINMTHKKDTAGHLRACICNQRSCIRMCCPINQMFVSESFECSSINETISTTFNITTSNGKVKRVDILKNFEIIYGRVCDSSYFLTPSIYPEDEWKLDENGSIHLSNGLIITKEEYCLSPTYEDNSTELTINPLLCFKDVENVKSRIYGYAMILSLPFMVITILIYMIIPELRNLHGKSLSCYLLGLVVGYSCLGYILVQNGIVPTDSKCKALGYVSYFSFMASFFWLSVISFDLWWNFRGTQGINKSKEWKRFLLYSLYSWGMATIFLIILLVVANSNVPSIYHHGIGVGQCWLETKKWITLAYFYGPIIIIIGFNISMFIMTSMKIHTVQKEMARIIAKEDSHRNLHKEKAKFGLFLRLFIVMGVTWSMEIVSWFLESWEWLFYVSDICNAIQGLIIFSLFVMKAKVKHLILKRYRTIRGIELRTSQYSTKTTNSQITMTTVNVPQDKQEQNLMSK